MATPLTRLSPQELSKKLPELIQNRSSFEVWDQDFESLIEAVPLIEAEIESQQLTCRIYTKGRILAAGAGIFSFGAGLAVLAGIAAHNILTYNPDYEICRDLANSKILVEFKK